MNNDCLICHRQNIEKLVNKAILNDTDRDNYISRLNNIIDNNKDATMVYVSALVHREAGELLKLGDIYKKEKQEANNLLLSSYEKWVKQVQNSDNPLRLAMKLAIIGNIIDYGAPSIPDNIEQYIDNKISHPVVLDHSDMLFDKIQSAKNILYLGDNAGEIVFDKLFIETIGHKNITYAVRGRPVINDVTYDEAVYTGITEICNVISNGFDAPSTLLPYCSDSFKKAFEEADLIISKGQGNFEGLMKLNKPNLYFLLTAKCDYIAGLLNVNKGDLVVANANIINIAKCL